MTTQTAVFERARALILEIGWARGCYARDGKGELTLPSDPLTTKIGLLGALCQASVKSFGEFREAGDYRTICQLFRNCAIGGRWITDWEDERGRTQEDIVAALDRAIAQSRMSIDVI